MESKGGDQPSTGAATIDLWTLASQLQSIHTPSNANRQPECLRCLDGVRGRCQRRPGGLNIR